MLELLRETLSKHFNTIQLNQTLLFGLSVDVIGSPSTYKHTDYIHSDIHFPIDVHTYSIYSATEPIGRGSKIRARRILRTKSPDRGETIRYVVSDSVQSIMGMGVFECIKRIEKYYEHGNNIFRSANAQRNAQYIHANTAG